MVGSADEIRRQLGVLRRRDKNIAAAIKFAGLPEPRVIGPGFATLIRIVGNQQVSTAAGNAIFAKLKKNAGRISAPRLIEMGEDGMRASGFSGQKARYALGLAEAVAARKLNLKALERASDDEVRATLTSYKGLGAWSADIYLMFGMGRHDVWPVGDLALQVAVQLLHGRDARPTARELTALGEIWRPYRSCVSLLLWRYYGATMAARAAGKSR